MRITGLILSVGIAVAVGCLLDGSSQEARAINCDNVCNSLRVVVHCRFLGETLDGRPSPYQGQQFYLPCCNGTYKFGPETKGSIITYTVKVNGKNVTKTFNALAQYDTSTQQSGSCASVQSQGNQAHWLFGATQTCPCPCTPSNPPPAGVPNGYNICPDVEGVYPGTLATGGIVGWYVIDLWGCQ